MEGIFLMEKWKKGNGEMIGFAVVAVLICSIFIIMVAFLQLSVGLNAIQKALSVTGRSVAICTSMDDATTQAQRVAESAITYTGIENIQTSVDWVNSGDDWEGGKFVNVTVSAKVNTLAPFITKRYQKKVLICIENGVAGGRTIMIPDPFGGYMTYEGWQLNTDTSSRQYQIRMRSGEPFTDDGFGIINGRYVVACTQYFGEVGDYVDWYLENGEVIHSIIGDAKSYSDDGISIYGHDGGHNTIEFCVDLRSWYVYLGNGRYRGTHANPGTSVCRPEWSSRVYKAVNLGRNYLD